MSAESQVQLWQIIEGMPAWVQVCHLDGAVELVNRAATQISGYTAAELVGRSWPYPWLELPQEHGASAQPGGAPAWPYRDAGQRPASPVEFEAICRTKAGEAKHLSVTISLLADAEGQPPRALLMAWDVTRQRRQEAEARQAQKMHVVNQLAAGVAHDVNNNLAVILGYSEYLLTLLKKPEQEVHQALSAILDQSKECADTVRRIQLFSRPVARRQFVPVDLNQVVLEAVQGAQASMPDQANPQIRVETALEPVPAVPGHLASLREAVASLISNSVDALPHGGVISVRTRAEGDFVTLTVTDNGEGISETDMGRIFDPFFTTKGPSRSGLGLSIAYNLITQHGGAVEAVSQPGRGATFTVRLPAPSLNREKSPAGVGGGQRTSLSVLVVDDEPHVAGVVRTFLESLGHGVTVCPDGPTALDVFREKKFDLAVVDLGMPLMDGYELARRLNQERADFPILVSTGWDVTREDMQERGARVMGVVQKPFSVKELARAIDQVLAVAR